jgi:hypothetical protein
VNRAAEDEGAFAVEQQGAVIVGDVHG